MQVILLERVAKLGQMGEVVDVKPGYARNFLLPQGKAMNATDVNIAQFEAEKAQLEARNLETKKEAASLGDKLSGETFIVIRQASDAGALYGSVTTRDAAEAATDGGFSVDRGQIILDKPIKELGMHDVIARLHPEVEATFTLNVARSAEEAELQAQGVDIQEMEAEQAAEEEFEIAELFEDIGAAQLDELETEAEQAASDGASEEAAAETDDADENADET